MGAVMTDLDDTPAMSNESAPEEDKNVSETNRSIEKQNLDHPCKDTCSGWQQGYEVGVSENQTLRAQLAIARGALEWLLHDSQHSEHYCGEDECPVDNARKALTQLDCEPHEIRHDTTVEPYITTIVWKKEDDDEK